MTDKIKAAFNERGFEILTTTLLGIVILMLGWYIDRITDIQDSQNDKINTLESHQNNIANILANDPDTKDGDCMELRKIYFTTRGANQ